MFDFDAHARGSAERGGPRRIHETHNPSVKEERIPAREDKADFDAFPDAPHLVGLQKQSVSAQIERMRGDKAWPGITSRLDDGSVQISRCSACTCEPLFQTLPPEHIASWLYRLSKDARSFFQFKE
jgi:hypothetical protein